MTTISKIAHRYLFVDPLADMPRFTEPLALPPNKKKTGAVKAKRASKKRRNKKK